MRTARRLAARGASLRDDLVAALLPARCVLCGACGEPVCAGCAPGLAPAPPAPAPAPVDWWASPYAYDGAVRALIVRAKYRGERDVFRSLARVVARAARGAPFTVDVVTWPPASRARRARTGVDHARVLGRAVARELGVPAAALLARAGHDAPQTGRARTARHAGPRIRLAASRGVPASVLVVDDVATTGGTLVAVARALRAGGARQVAAVTLARTPAPGSGARDPAYTSVTNPVTVSR